MLHANLEKEILALEGEIQAMTKESATDASVALKGLLLRKFQRWAVTMCLYFKADVSASFAFAFTFYINSECKQLF